MLIALFGTEEDRSYLPYLRELIGAHSVKVQLSPVEYVAALKSKIESNNIDAIICTCPKLLPILLGTQSDFRHPVDKRGNKSKLTLHDYAGNFFYWGKVQVLILNPLQQLVTTPTGKLVFERFISKLTRPEKWFAASQFTWEVWQPKTSASLLAKFSTARILSVDIETYRDDPLRRMHCVGYAGLFADGSVHTVVVPYKDMLAHDFVRKLNASAPPKLFQNGLYDNLYFLRWNVPAHNWLFDTNILFHCWYSELPKRLDFLAAFNIRVIRFWKDDSVGSEHNKFEYNAKDCWATLMAWCSLVLEAPAWAHSNYLQEFPLVFPCLHCEADGLSVDKAAFEVGKKAAAEALAHSASKLAAWIGPAFNPNSPLQCVRLLTVLGVKGAESAEAKELVACAAMHPLNELIISELLAYRRQSKLLSTYFVYEKFWNDRLFYKLNPAGTDTGRLASSESSFWCGLQIQNIPRGGRVKEYIVPDAGWQLAENDYSQSEARCVGYMSGCESLITVLESDKDFHKHNASAFFGLPYDKIDKQLRDLAKRVNHGANYNMGATVLLETMGPKRVAEARVLLKLPGKWSLTQVCQHLLRAYELTYVEIKRDWYNAIKLEINRTKKLVSPLGWTRIFFGDPSKSKMALNAAVAHGPQNLSVSIINKVFYKLWHDSVYGDLRGRLRIKAQVHDSILYCYKGDEVPAIVSERMRHPIKVGGRTMLIPNDTSAGGKSWAALK